jgi:outer membrane murein-binding lipoprotein Lpp
MNRARRYATAVLGVTLLAGCSPGPTDVDAATSRQMQTVVEEIATSASGADYTTAVAKLDSLQSRLDQALAAGQVGSQRGAQIQTAIGQVRADLEALSRTPTASPTSPATVTPRSNPDNSATSGASTRHKGKSKG